MHKQRTEQLTKYATYASVTVATMIIIMKIAAWIYTDSLSLLASLADSVLDVIASVLNLLAVHYALTPADADHRFGHNKAEDISAFAQSAFIAGSALFIVIQSLGRIIDPHPLTNETIGIAVMVVSMGLTFMLVSFQKYVIKLSNSTVIKADYLHYLTDLLVNFVVILSLTLSLYFDLGVIDTLFSLLIAAYIFRGAYQVGKGAFDNLMDKEMPDIDRNRIIDTILLHKMVDGMHDLRTRISGSKKFIQFHVELDGDISLSKADKIADELEKDIAQLFPDAEIIIHQDPTCDLTNNEIELGRIVKKPVK